jgi:hypothetical protein
MKSAFSKYFKKTIIILGYLGYCTNVLASAGLFYLGPRYAETPIAEYVSWMRRHSFLFAHTIVMMPLWLALQLCVWRVYFTSQNHLRKIA